MSSTARKKTPAKRPAARTVKRKRPVAQRRTSARRSNPSPKFVLPLFLSLCILVCLGALGFLGYRSVTASQFFDVSRVEVNGVKRASQSEIERIVRSGTEKRGVWNADLDLMKATIEKQPFVASAAVSRVLPDGVVVSVVEKIPEAVVRLRSGEYLVDETGSLLAKANGPEPELPFVLTGWDEEKSEKAEKENVERVKMYRKMLSEWRQFDLAARISSVDIADLREPRAFTEDSGSTVSIAVGRDNYGEHLKRGINAIVGKGDTFEAVNLVGQNMILAPRKTQ